MLQGCGRQFRLRIAPVPSPGGLAFVSEPAGLDFGAVLALATARGADTALLAELLPAVEAKIMAGIPDEGGDDGE